MDISKESFPMFYLSDKKYNLVLDKTKINLYADIKYFKGIKKVGKIK